MLTYLSNYIVPIQDSIPPSLASLKLKPLYEPTPVKFTFATIGWKILAGLLLVLLIVFLYVHIKKYIRNKYRRDAIKRLSEINDVESCLIILKQVAIHTYGREKTATLEGMAWLEFLDTTGKHIDFSSMAGDIRKVIYENQSLNDAITSKLLLNTRKWIETHA